MKWTLFGVGIAATLVAVILITIYARKQLKKALAEAESSSDSDHIGERVIPPEQDTREVEQGVTPERSEPTLTEA